MFILALAVCAYQTMAYETQLKFKEEQVKSLLDAVCPGYRFEGIKEAPGNGDTAAKWSFLLATK